MLYWLLRHLPLSYKSRKGYDQAWTLVELLLILSILGTLTAIAVPVYTGYLDKQRKTTAIVDISNIESQIERFKALSGRPPNNFAEAGIAASNDPWRHPYNYLRIQGINPPGARRDKFLKPLNSDYDLYSMGKDGATTANLTGGKARDDIIRANNGTFIGLASEY